MDRFHTWYCMMCGQANRNNFSCDKCEATRPGVGMIIYLIIGFLFGILLV